MATGEDIDDETLGGAEMHAHVSGVSDYIAEDDRDAIRIGRQIVAQLNTQKALASRRRSPREPYYDTEELLGVIPADPRIPFDMREVIARIVDGSEFLEFKRDYGPTLITRACSYQWLPCWHLGEQWYTFFRVRDESDAIHSTLQSIPHASSLPAKYHRFHGGHQVRTRGYSETRV